MKCTYCQADNPPNALLCVDCGLAMINCCAHCQMELPAGARFCMNCGQPVLGTEPIDDSRYTNIATSAPAQLVDKVRAAASLSGERRMVTAMFVDIVGSTTLAEQVGQEIWAGIVDGSCERSCSVIYRYEGTVARLHGDELLAFFGAPVAHEDDPVRAVRAALDLLEKLRKYKREIWEEYNIDFSVRISLSTGPVIIGPISDDLKYEYTAMGGAINLAAKIEAIKNPMAVLVSEHTYQLVAPFFHFTDLGELQAENQADSVKIYRVDRARVKPRRLSGLDEYESPMVGRKSELMTLLQLGQAVHAGLGRVALVVSEPGYGKTRLISEWKEAFSRANPDSPIQWIVGHNQSYDMGQPYHLVINLLHSLINIPLEASEPEIRAALRIHIEDLFGTIDEQIIDSQAMDVYPYLAHMLSLNLEGRALERIKLLDPLGLRDQYQTALGRLINTIAHRTPLIVILEDLQWADPSSVELLSNLLLKISTTPILYCLVTRPIHDSPGWELVTAARDAMRGRFTEIVLQPLSADDSQQIVSDMLKTENLPNEMRTSIMNRSEGNPLFIREVIRMLVDRGLIVQQNGNWITAGKMRTTDIPDSLHGLLLARVDDLSDGEKHTLRVASVIGRLFQIRVLERVMGDVEPEDKLISRLGALESAGLTRVSNVTPELIYAFHNALIYEVTYGSLLESDRQMLHHLVGEALEDLYPGELSSEELAPRLGHHFFEAGDFRRAFNYFTRAGEAALASFANTEAEDYFRKAIHLADSDSSRALSLTGLGQALRGQSRIEECIKVWREAINLYTNMDAESNDLIARLYARSARAAWEGGNTPQNLSLCKEGLEIVAGVNPSPGLALLVHEAARAFLFNGFNEDAERLCQQALNMAKDLDIPAVQADALATFGLIRAHSPETALQALTEAIDIAESAGLLSQAARAHNNLAALMANKIQDFPTARDHYRRSAELRRLKGSSAGELLSLGGVAEISLLLGDLKGTQATIPVLSQLLNDVVNPGPAVFHYRKIEALLDRYRGDLVLASQRLQDLQNEERQRGNLQNLIEVDSHLLEIMVESTFLQTENKMNGYEEAERLYEEAQKICEAGIGDLEWLCYLMSMVRVYQGEYNDARNLQDQTHTTTTQTSPINSGWLSYSKARLAIAEERWNEAITAYERTIDIFTRLQMRWWKARVLLDCAMMYMNKGLPADIERSYPLMREALAAFNDMGATFYSRFVEDKLQALEAKSYSQAIAHQKAAQELARAGKLQGDFLPGKPPHIPGWQVSAILIPARETSGDFYDFIQLPDGRWGIVIADVADKGVGAALYMTLSHTLIRTFAQEHPHRPDLVLSAVNQRILADTPANLFVTVFYGVLDPNSGNFEYCNAGHNPPYYIKSHDKLQVQELNRTGLPLGLFEHKTWGSRDIQLAEGELLVLYTDGVTEAQDPHNDFYGKDRLLARVHSLLGRSAREIQELVLADIEEFSGDMQKGDDLTLMIISRTEHSTFI